MLPIYKRAATLPSNFELIKKINLMKKFILMIAVSGSFVMCKKGETTQSQFEKAVNSADSTAAAASETINKVSDQASEALDSASIKIKEFDHVKDEVREKMENTSKSIDSLSDKISSTKLETKAEKTDSAEKKKEKIIVHVPAPKIIRATKIVYKDQQKKENYEITAAKNRMVKSGFISLKTDNADTVKEVIKDEVKRNNGFIKSENLSYTVNERAKNTSSSYAENNQKVYEIQVKIPLRNFDDLMNDLSNMGEIENKNVEVFGNQYAENSICSISITLSDKTEVQREPETFGEKSLAALSSGWEVVTSILLFILPLWPIILIAGIGYYFYKKRNKKLPDNDHH